MNSERPIPIGARNVPLCFSAASMRIVKMSKAVQNISINRPRGMETPAARVVRTLRSPGNSVDTTAEAAIPPTI